MQKLLLAIIILVGFLLRILWLDKYPTGFTPDEASFGYDAYSLLKTGKDQWGESWPITFRSFGDFKLPVYTYLTLPSVALFGLTEFSTRLPGALIGALAVYATFLMTTKLFNWRMGILSTLLLAVSPWHLPLSRGAFEANLTVFFSSLGVWLFLEGLKKPKLLILSALTFGVNLFTYHSARLFTPLLVASLVLLYKKELTNYTLIRMSVWKHKWPVLCFFIALIIAAFTMFTGAGARGADIAIFNPTGGWGALSDERYSAVLSGLPDDLARLFSNKLTFTIREFTKNYLSYLSPQFLFTQGAGEWTYGMVAGHGVLYLFELLFISFFIISLTKGHMSAGTTLIIVWILMSIIPAALTKGPGYAANRAATMMPALQIASAIGAAAFLDYVNKKRIRARPLILVCIALIFISSFLYNYFFSSQKNMQKGMLAGRKELIEIAEKQENKKKDVVMSKRLSEPHTYVAFYTKWDPSDYQKESQDWLRYEKDKLKFVDQLGEYKLGRYTFRDINYEVDSLLPNTLILPTYENR